MFLIFLNICLAFEVLCLMAWLLLKVSEHAHVLLLGKEESIIIFGKEYVNMCHLIRCFFFNVFMFQSKTSVYFSLQFV